MLLGFALFGFCAGFGAATGLIFVFDPPKQSQLNRLVGDFVLIKRSYIRGNIALCPGRQIILVRPRVYGLSAVAQRPTLGAALAHAIAAVNLRRLRPGLTPRLKGGLSLTAGIGSQIGAHFILCGEAAAPGRRLI